jgi:uncharacterized membrane protein (DUF485 family)
MSTDTPTPSQVPGYFEVQSAPDFVRLRRALRGFVFPMTAAFFLWYALYVLLCAYARDLMAVRVIGNVNVGLVFGLLQFVSTFLIAWLYARYAGRRLDPIADRVRAELEQREVSR